MKIAIISSTVFACPLSGYGGLEYITFHQAEGLGKLGHEVSLIAPNGSKCDHATVISTGPPGQIDEHKAYSTFWNQLPKFDCIIDSSWQKWSYILKSEGKLKIPVLGVCHAPINTMFSSMPPVEKPCFVCISKDQANHFESIFERPARIANNGIDLDYYKHTGQQRNNRFLFLARFSSIKGADLAIQACKQANVGLDLVGDTTITGEPGYFQGCQQACDGQQLRMIGPATRGETVAWYSKSFCFLHPTMRFREPFGLAPVEAQACFLPVIGWNRGALPETVIHGETGFLVSSVEEMTNAIRGVAENGISQAGRERCRENASRFSIQNMVKRYEELCIEAIDTGGW